jgi:predicted DCC family thiol-disulfide oxidoreductase YuxK
MARQYQRYPLELFLWCFEDALSRGARSIDDIRDNWIRRSSDFARLSHLTLRQLLAETADELLDQTELATSRAWNRVVVDRDDKRFEHIEEAKSDNAVEDALHMLAGWYWRMLTRMEDPAAEQMMKLGGSDRIGMEWFITWLGDRMDIRVTDIVHEIFSDLVFAQHMRIALARFDGKAQRLRFLLGDSGIEPAVSARKDFANLKLPWMPDRLQSLIGLLCDCDVLSMRDGTLYLGPAAGSVE